MPRILPVYKKVVTGGGGGAQPGGWGPDFGGTDGDQFNVGISQVMDAVSLDHEKTVGVSVVPEIGLLNDKSCGCHLAGEVLGAPFWQTEAHAALAAAASEITVSKPAGTADGELMLMFVGVNSAAAPLDINTPAGWTFIRTDTIGNARVRSFRRIASGEPASYTVTFTANADQATAEIHRVIAVDTATPIDANAGATVAVADLDPDPSAPAVTTTVVNTLVFAFLFHAHAAVAQTHTPPANHVERTDFESTNVSKWGSTSATRVFAAIGSTGAAEFDCTEAVGTDGIMQRIAVRPATLVIAS